MAGCNQLMIMETHFAEKQGYDGLPKGEFLRMAINPYNGKLVVNYNSVEKYQETLLEILDMFMGEVAASNGAATSHGLNALRDDVQSGAYRRRVKMKGKMKVYKCEAPGKDKRKIG